MNDFTPMSDWYELQAGFHRGSRGPWRDLEEAVRLFGNALVDGMAEIGKGVIYAWNATRDDIARHTARSPWTALLVIAALAFVIGWLMGR